MRQQRHLATRVVIATQEPTISPVLLDLCNVTIIHRFTSPAWFRAIKAHIAGAHRDGPAAEDNPGRDLFRQIVHLGTGEALFFCPTALLDVEVVDAPVVGEDNGEDQGAADSLAYMSGKHRVRRMGPGHAHVRVRRRITVDGGRSMIEW